MPEVLYPVAKTKEGGWLWIDDATPSIEAYCPECSERMVARLGQIRRHHFAHLVASVGCRGESSIHTVAKWVLAYTLEKIGQVRFQTNCPWNKGFCPQTKCRCIHHKLDIEQVAIEEQADDGYRPDITVALRDGGVIPVEVVYKNPVSKEKWDHYYRERQPVVVWRINDDTDLFTPPLIESTKGVYHDWLSLRNPCDFGGSRHLMIFVPMEMHRTPICPDEQPIGLHYYAKDCWKCHKQINIPLIPIELCEELGFGYDITYGDGGPDEQEYANVVERWNWNFVREVRRASGIIINGAKTPIYGNPRWGLHTFCPHCGIVQGQGYISRDIDECAFEVAGIIRLNKRLCQE